MKITKVEMKSGSRMIRIGFGQNESRWFARVDLWFVGFRVSH